MLRLRLTRAQYRELRIAAATAEMSITALTTRIVAQWLEQYSRDARSTGESQKKLDNIDNT